MEDEVITNYFVKHCPFCGGVVPDDRWGETVSYCRGNRGITWWYCFCYTEDDREFIDTDWPADGTQQD